ncbi:CLUMA_CG019943, isoform A [Clunio marinus]|uniref:Transcription initiation factor TFIID subunit 12 n=1 Tax=Clunio marinus TaxID=568069 RepID=A0A1J1J3D0_9DIPT|nr:CLUMA_CG019943, isoform A [Clunio marinus]
MDTEMNDLASPSQSSPSMTGNSNQTKTNSSSESSVLLTKPRLQELVREVDPNEQLDEEVEDCLLQIADEFVENVINGSCLIAKHRIQNGSNRDNKVEVKDVQLFLERNWNLWIPGFGTEELRPYKRTQVTEAHKQRTALIRKALKKY